MSDRRISEFKPGRKHGRTGFRVSPVDVGFVIEQTTDFERAKDPDCPGKTPTEAHTQFMRASKLGFLPPFLVDRRVSRAARPNEGIDKPGGRGGGDVESERREYEWGGEAAGAKLVDYDVDETRNLLESEDDVTLVGEVTVVLRGFVLWGVEAGWV